MSDLSVGSRWQQLTPERVSDFVLRFGLVATALVLWFSMHALRAGETIDVTLPIWLGLVQHGLAFALGVFALLRRTPRWSVWLIVTALAFVLLNHVLKYIADEYRGGGPFLLDTYLYMEYAAQVLRAGGNPYLHETIDMFRAFRVHQDVTTLLLRGDVYSGVPYPPLSFLSLIPFHWLGIQSNMSYLLFFALSMLVLFLNSPAWLRPVIVLPFFVNPFFIQLAIGGLNDIAWVFLVMMMIVHWRRLTLSAVWFGLACAMKQQPWILAPFLLIRLWHESRALPLHWRLLRWVRFGGISAAVFLLINLPFALMNFDGWFRGLMDNFSDGIMILGTGLSRLTEANVVMIPKTAYTVLTVLSLLVTLWMYWRYHDDWKEAIWMLPGIVFFFGYRSLPHYWILLALPLLLAVVKYLPDLSVSTPETTNAPRRSPSRRLTLVGLAGATAVVVVMVGWYALRPPLVTIALETPYRGLDNQIDNLTVTVENRSDDTLTPRFTVRSRSNPLHKGQFWHIDSGPQTLAPGESAQYRLIGTWPLWSFDYHQGAEVVVVDADGYRLRAVTTIPENFDALHPGVIPNGDFQLWQDEEVVPVYWQLSQLTAASVTPTKADEQGQRDGVRLIANGVSGADYAFARLGTQIIFPETPIELWVRPPANANQLPALDSIYGLELLADGNRVWVLFGADTDSGQLDDNIYYWMTAAPPAEWSRHVLDLRAIFTELGIAPHDLSVQSVERFENLNYPRTRLTFRLITGGRNQPDDVLFADFGSVTNKSLFPDRGQMVQQAVENPERILLWHGTQNRLARNYAVALDYFDQVLALDPDNALAMVGIGWVHYGRGEMVAAMDEFARARTLMQANTDRYTPAEIGTTYEGEGWVMLAEERCFDAAIAFEQYRTRALDSTYPSEEIEACGPLIPNASQITVSGSD